ncbi:unnamed protein product [Prunus brigantina]
MTINTHQPARGPTHGDKLQLNPHKLNLLIYPTGRPPKGIDPWEPRKKLARAAQDWFHTLPSASIGNFKEFALIFTKEYTSYKTVRKHANHLFNLFKKPDESLRDYLRRFKAEKANIIGCNDQVASSAFKKGLPIEH